VTEMVFLLGRMGNNKEALHIIIERLGDVARVNFFYSLNYMSLIVIIPRLSTLPKSKTMTTCGRTCSNILRRVHVRFSLASVLTLLIQIDSLHPGPPRECRRGDRPYSTHPSHQEWARDSWSTPSAYQDLARLPPTAGVTRRSSCGSRFGRCTRCARAAPCAKWRVLPHRCVRFSYLICMN